MSRGQPPLGGCVLKHCIGRLKFQAAFQPPLGGCVLKLDSRTRQSHAAAAAFRRLCVETGKSDAEYIDFEQPPLGGCVLKQDCILTCMQKRFQPPLGGCVLKQVVVMLQILRVLQPPLGGCVLKPQS